MDVVVTLNVEGTGVKQLEGGLGAFSWVIFKNFLYWEKTTWEEGRGVERRITLG